MDESPRCTGVFGGFLGGGGDINAAASLASRRPKGAFTPGSWGRGTGGFTGGDGGDGGDGAAGVPGDCALPSGFAAAGGEESSGESVSPLSSARAAFRPASMPVKSPTFPITPSTGSAESALAFGYVLSLPEYKPRRIPSMSGPAGGGRALRRSSTKPLLCRLSVTMSGGKVAVVQLIDSPFD